MSEQIKKRLFPEQEGFYLAITKVPIINDTYQISIKYYTEKDGFGDIGTEAVLLPNPDCKYASPSTWAPDIMQYTVSIPAADDILCWAEIPLDSKGQLYIRPAIECR